MTMGDHIVWVDLEMTGLDINTCHIIEMACIITDKDLNVIAESEDIIIHQPDDIMDNMNEWCTQHHGESGLTKSVKESTISLAQAECQMLEFIKGHVSKGTCPLAGNSVHADRLFLNKYMPDFLSHLHYRIIDVSTVKELCRRWYPKEFTNAPTKKLAHRALDDIRESIEELKYYREHLFK